MNRIGKLFTKIAAVMLAFAIAFTAVATYKIDANAQTSLQDVIPDKVRIDPLVTRNMTICMKLVDAGYKVKNLKTNSKNLKVFVTRLSRYNSSSSYKTLVNIGCFATKVGKYKVSFTLDNGSKKIKRNVTVYCKTGYGVKKVTLGGKRIDIDNPGAMAPVEGGVLKVKLNKNYVLKGIELESYTANDQKNMTRIPVKNGQYIKLSKIVEKDNYQGSNYIYSHHYEDMVAPTRIIVKYKDKKTQIEGYQSFLLHLLVNYVR